MNFLDADVRRPLGAVSAIVDGGNTVVFSPSGSHVENTRTGEKIPLVRKGGVYVMGRAVAMGVGDALSGGLRRMWGLRGLMRTEGWSSWTGWRRKIWEFSAGGRSWSWGGRPGE